MAEPRRFPLPWTVEETASCFVVRDANKQALAFVYCEDEQGSCRNCYSSRYAMSRLVG
jgi:hypothetical protein